MFVVYVIFVVHYYYLVMTNILLYINIHIFFYLYFLTYLYLTGLESSKINLNLNIKGQNLALNLPKL